MTFALPSYQPLRQVDVTLASEEGDRATLQLYTLGDAIRGGTLFAWSIAHAVPGRDVVKEAWASCQSDMAMRHVVGAMASRTHGDRVYYKCYCCSHPGSDCDNGRVRCRSCVEQIRKLIPRLTIDDVLEAMR